MRFKKIYVEITNVCNLSCTFCKKTNRVLRFMSVEEFQLIIEKIANYTSYIYLHVLGEPLLHDDLGDMLRICGANGIKVNITTNGTLIEKKANLLLNEEVRQINFSIHDIIETGENIDSYLNNILSFSLLASKKTYINLRLWNYDRERGKPAANDGIIREIVKFFEVKDIVIEKKKGHGIKICDNIYLQLHDIFSWPELGKARLFESGGCYGLKDHVGILVDGTVVPCCLDADGCLSLGNIFTGNFSDIINCQEAAQIYEGFKERRVAAELCKTCGFAAAL